MAEPRNLLAGRNLLPDLAINKPAPGFIKQNPEQIRQEEFQKLAQEQGPIRTGAISTGRGLAKIGRALGLVEPEAEAEKQAFKALGEERPITTVIGESVGEALPFAAVPVGAIPGTAARVAAATGLGALEGGLIVKGSGGTESEQLKGAGIGGGVAGTVEAGLPHVLRIGSQLIRKYLKRAPKTTLLRPDGTPTNELSDALDSAGLEFDDLQDAAMELISDQQPGAKPEQVARAARFEDLGIPTSKGIIAKDSPGGFKQLADEQRLLASSSDEAADQFRSLKLAESEAVKGNLQQIIDKAGVPENVGEELKSALTNRKNILKNKKNALYTQAANAAKDKGFIPFPVDNIRSALPDARTIREISDFEPQKSEALLNLLAEFGIDTSKEATERLKTKNIEPIILNFKTFDTFRKSLNRLMDVGPGQPNHMAVLAGPIKDALDNEANAMVGIMEKAGVDDIILAPLKEAQATVKTLKTEFSPQSIVGKLTGLRPDNFTPVIEASHVLKNIVGTNKPIELLDRTITSLKKAGPDGIKAIGDIQAATVLDLIESGFKAQTRQIEGIRTFGPVAFKNRLNQIGDKKLKLIFSTNPELLKDLNKLKAISDDLTIPSDAVPKGSGPVNLDIMSKLGLTALMAKLPGVGPFLGEGLKKLAESSGKRKTLKAAIDLNPELKKSISVIESELPSVLVAFGLTALGKDENK